MPTVGDNKLTMQGYKLISLEVAKGGGIHGKTVAACQTQVSK
jgi:hypothetical protein